MLEKAGDEGPVVINQIIYAEISVRYQTVEQLDGDLPSVYFAQYKRRTGTKRSPMPDFYIGAHAAVTGMTLLTRDPRRYREYFPKLRLVSP